MFLLLVYPHAFLGDILAELSQSSGLIRDGSEFVSLILTLSVIYGIWKTFNTTDKRIKKKVMQQKWYWNNENLWPINWDETDNVLYNNKKKILESWANPRKGLPLNLRGIF